VLGAVTALVYPLVWPRAELGWHLLAACTAALLPIAGLGSWSRRGGAWGSLPGLWPAWRLGAVVERRELAQHLSAQRGRALRSLWLPPIAYRWRWWLVPALALSLALIAYGWHHPRLRVINLTRERVWLAVDGALVAAVDPAGVDLASATVVLRLPRGERHLQAFDERHHPIGSTRARLESGRDHLYAPATAERCFWLELTGYGRDPSHEVRPLASRDRFFSLDADIDTWFSDTPQPPSFDRRSTGGTLTSLRQSPCARAPETVRRAASAVGP
jgi:hypothetical protein